MDNSKKAVPLKDDATKLLLREGAQSYFHAMSALVEYRREVQKRCRDVLLRHWIIIMASQGWVGACPKYNEGSRGCLVPTWKFQGECTSQPRSGIRPPPIPGDHDALLQRQPTSILLRHRPARQDHARLRPGRCRHTATCRVTSRACSRRSHRSRTVS